MADNVVANAGAGGATFATDDIAGVQYPRTKMTWGADGTANDTDTASGKALPIQIRNSTGTELATTGAPIQVADAGGSLTVDSGQLPGSLGQKAMAASLGVVIASDQSAVPVSASSLPLPTGAATETTLSALNTKTATAKTSDYDTGAGTDTVPMTGIALPGAGGAVQGGTATNPVRTDPTGTTAQPITDNGGSVTVDSAQLPAALVSGRLDVNIGAASGTVTVDSELPAAAALADGASNPTAPAVGADNSVFNGTTWDRMRSVVNGQDTTGTGVQAAGLLGQLDDVSTGAVTENQFAPVRISSRRALLVEGVASGTAVKVDGSAVNQPVTDAGGSLTVDSAQLPSSLGQKTMANSIGVAIASDQGAVPASQSGTWTVQPGNTANTTPWLVTPTPATSGGLSISRTVSGASTNATSAKGSAGQVFGWVVTNSNAAARYLKLYNKATSPTVGSDTPVATIMIPAGGGVSFNSDMGIAFGTGIAYALTTGAADSDTGAVAANEIILNLFYK